MPQKLDGSTPSAPSSARDIDALDQGKVGRVRPHPDRAEWDPARADKVAAMPRKIASSTTVERDELLEFARARHHVIVMTTRADGTVQASPVSAGIDPQGRVVVATYPQRAKVANARRHPVGAALFLSDDWNGPWAQVSGRLEVVDLPDAVEPLVDYYRAIAGEHPDWDEYRQAMVDQGKCLLRLTIHGWGPIATGGFPAHLGDT